MSNVVRFQPAARKVGQAKSAAGGGIPALLGCFAAHRRTMNDAFWLKENGELLSILATSGHRLPAEDLACYAPFHDGLEARLAFFPQYARMLLAVAVWLEAVGMPGDAAARLAARIREGGLDQSEVNDMARAEMRLLMARAGGRADDDPGLTGRLLRFASRAATFAVPNPRAAYDLLHVVFYLTDYGRQRADLPAEIFASLRNVGTLAMLDADSDLLAETCLALHWAGAEVPADWLMSLEEGRAEMRVLKASLSQGGDGYHIFLVNHWLFATMGQTAFQDSFEAAPMIFHAPRAEQTPLREMSLALLAMGDARQADWGRMRLRCHSALSAPARRLLDRAEAACPEFDRFFADFARAGGGQTQRAVTA